MKRKVVKKSPAKAKPKAQPSQSFKASEVLAVAAIMLVEGEHPAKTCCSAIGKAVRQLTGAQAERKKNGKVKQSMPHHPLYKRAVAYIECFRPTKNEIGGYGSGKVTKGTWWRTPSHPRIYANKTERLIALSWAFLDALKAKD